MKTLKILLFTLLFCTGFHAAFAQHDFTKLDAWLDDNSDKMGGRTMLVIYQNDRLVYSRSANKMNMQQKMVGRMASRRHGLTVNNNNYTLSTRQPIASCSKWLSAALVMTFIDEGKLSLNDTVGKFLPVLAKCGKGGITIGQCLSHQTGIMPLPLKGDLQEMKNYSSMDDAMQGIATRPMEGQPGKVFHYSNIGLPIAGAVIETIGGESFQALFAERIAKPLNMKNTDYGNRKVALPAGGGISTPEDYLNFLEMIMDKGIFNGKRILSESSIAQMQVNRITNDVKVAYSPGEVGEMGYGYGEWVAKNSTIDNLSQAVSSPGLFGSYPWVNNTSKYAAFLMTFYVNNKGRAARYKQLKQLVDEALK